MDLPDCPPGAEGYHDSVTEVAKKPTGEGEDSCTKGLRWGARHDSFAASQAEQEFSEHLNSLKIRVENAGTRPMVERRGRDVSGKWIYLCYPCAAVCSGETILQTHISGKKHKTKLALRNIWPQSIFDEHPYILSEKGSNKPTASGQGMDKVLQKMAEEVELFNKNASELDNVFAKYKNVPCHIQESIDIIKAPLLGVEYLIEHPPEQSHYEPSYICTLCTKHGHPRTIINHMTCFWHRYNYLVRHFTKACKMLTPYRAQPKYREGVSVIMNRVAQRIEDTFGRLRPLHIDKEEYEKDKERIHQWIFKGHHFSENTGHSFEEVVDVDLITSLHDSNEESKAKTMNKMRDPSPPVVAAPSKPHYRARERRPSAGSLSDISDEQRPERGGGGRDRPPFRGVRNEPKPRFEPYAERERRESPTFRSRYALRNNQPEKGKPVEKDKKPPNYEYKVKLAEEKCKLAEDSAKKTLAYHEKNPEKHPLYPEEWKKFWNRRYKEIQAEGKDPSKHDFKPEWIVFWTSRMKELHDQELRVNIHEIYRKLCLPPPPPAAARDDRERVDERRRSPELRRRSPEPRRRSPELRRRSPELRRRSPSPRRRSPSPRRAYDPRRRSPELRPVRPDHRRDFDNRRREPEYRRDIRTPDYRRSPSRHMEKRPSPGRINNFVPIRSRSPVSRTRSPARTHIVVESLRRSRSPLSRRGDPGAARNRSPHPPHHGSGDLHTVMISDDELKPAPRPSPHPPHHGSGDLHTVMISDDELKPDDGGVSPWNSSHSLESLGSLPDARSPPRPRSRGSRAGSLASHAPSHHGHKREYGRPADPQDLGPAENVVATLRLLVALEDYLGSLGPKIVDLLAEALKMEKECANSSEELLVRESAVVLLETAKEKLKGAAQAGLVPSAAAGALRGAVVRTAATLHEADTRARRKQQQQQYTSSANTSSGSAAVPVAGVGAVDREQIAAQIAAALVAQGKTDVSTEELAQLVDDVVGMAEAKKREAEVKKKVEARAFADKASRPPPPAKSSGASALQMLQSAYDENDKKEKEKENAPDAMDGLSDSDLETLLKNFNELSAEEQHSLIAYLKKLEAREPQRVERLRQYVSAAADDPPPVVAQAPPVAPTKPVETIESDDEDYTVEEVFQSATQKVKEDQIRQEMEIVKKSLEESKAVVPEPEVAKPALLDITKNISSASDIFALVQASIQSKSSGGSAPVNPTPDVVTSNLQPRSFGDRPDAAPVLTESTRALLQTPMNQMPTLQLNSFGQQGPGNQAPGFQGQGNQGPGFQGQGNQGPGFQGQGNQSSGFQGQGSQSSGFPGQGSQGLDLVLESLGFQAQGNQGPGFQGQGNQGPGFQGQGNQGSGFQQGHGNQGQGFQQGQGNQGPGFRSGPPNAPPNQNFGGNRNFQNQNDSFNNQPWEQRQPMNSNIPPLNNNMPPMNNNMQPMNNNNMSSMNSNMNENRGSLLGPPPPLMGQRPAPFENQNQYNQPPTRGNYMNAQNNMNQNQQPNMNNMPPQQYGNNNNNQSNFRGRGGRGHYGGGGSNMRGRGRGYY